MIVLKKKIHEGNAKKIYETDDPDQLIQEFKDNTMVIKNEKQTVIKGKGIINNQVSSFLFEYLEGFHVPTHFIKTLSNREMLVKRCEMIPIEIVIRNIAAGSLCERYGVEEGKILDFPILEYYLKDSKHHDPMINASHAISFGFVNGDELKTIDRFASKINAVLKSFFDRRGLKLVDLRLEFGRYKEKILLGDEISLDTCRFWDNSVDDKLDKDYFRLDGGNAETVYEEIKNRILK